MTTPSLHLDPPSFRQSAFPKVCCSQLLFVNGVTAKPVLFTGVAWILEYMKWYGRAPAYKI